jgi:hypothetical protein
MHQNSPVVTVWLWHTLSTSRLHCPHERAARLRQVEFAVWRVGFRGVDF